LTVFSNKNLKCIELPFQHTDYKEKFHKKYYSWEEHILHLLKQKLDFFCKIVCIFFYNPPKKNHFHLPIFSRSFWFMINVYIISGCNTILQSEPITAMTRLAAGENCIIKLSKTHELQRTKCFEYRARTGQPALHTDTNHRRIWRKIQNIFPQFSQNENIFFKNFSWFFPVYTTRRAIPVKQVGGGNFRTIIQFSPTFKTPYNIFLPPTTFFQWPGHYHTETFSSFVLFEPNDIFPPHQDLG